MFFDFRQNNTGGSFDVDHQAGISVNVIIEADDHNEANEIAQRIGLYFDGCSAGLDCSCCGDRWYRAWNDEGDDVPSTYGEPVKKKWDSKYSKWEKDGWEIYVHYKDGTVKGFGK